MSAPQILGIQPLSWGTETITGYVTESTTRDASTEEFTIMDENGQVITQITQFGEKTEYNIDVIPTSSATVPDVGDTVTVSSDKFVLINLGRKRVKKDVEKWTMKGVSYPGITLT